MARRAAILGIQRLLSPPDGRSLGSPVPVVRLLVDLLVLSNRPPGRSSGVDDVARRRKTLETGRDKRSRSLILCRLVPKLRPGNPHSLPAQRPQDIPDCLGTDFQRSSASAWKQSFRGSAFPSRAWERGLDASFIPKQSLRTGFVRLRSRETRATIQRSLAEGSPSLNAPDAIKPGTSKAKPNGRKVVGRFLSAADDSAQAATVDGPEQRGTAIWRISLSPTPPHNVVTQARRHDGNQAFPIVQRPIPHAQTK